MLYHLEPNSRRVRIARHCAVMNHIKTSPSFNALCCLEPILETNQICIALHRLESPQTRQNYIALFYFESCHDEPAFQRIVSSQTKLKTRQNCKALCRLDSHQDEWEFQRIVWF